MRRRGRYKRQHCRKGHRCILQSVVALLKGNPPPPLSTTRREYSLSGILGLHLKEETLSKVKFLHWTSMDNALQSKSIFKSVLRTYYECLGQLNRHATFSITSFRYDQLLAWWTSVQSEDRQNILIQFQRMNTDYYTSLILY